MHISLKVDKLDKESEEDRLQIGDLPSVSKEEDVAQEPEMTEQEGRREIRRLMNPDPEGAVQRPRFNRDDLASEFNNFSRQPFLEVLAEMIGAVPSQKAIRAFAVDHPDRWANAVATMSRLSGYHDKLEISGNISVDIQQMGDAQLLGAIEELTEKMERMEKGGTLIDQDAPDAIIDESGD